MDDKLYNAVDLVSDSDAYMRRALERKRPAEDIVTLRKALEHLCVLSYLLFLPPTNGL